MLLPKKLFKLLIIEVASIALLLVLANKINIPKAKAQSTPDVACIGKSVALYMNEVISGAGNLTHIKLLSPAFNMTSGYFQGIIDSMVLNGAQFRYLSGIAGNSYNTNSPLGSITGYATNAVNYLNSKAGTSLPVFLTEVGMFDHFQGVQRSTALFNLTYQLSLIKGGYYNGVRYLGALLFDPLGTNSDPDFNYNRMNANEIRTLCGIGQSCGLIGENFATYYGGASDCNYAQADTVGCPTLDRFGMNNTLEIAQNDPEGVLARIKFAHTLGLVPVIRIGVGSDSGGFDNPQDYVDFLTFIDSNVTGSVYAIAGPNEPETETWASTNCNSKIDNYPPYIPTPAACGNQNDPEFHVLRPYPAAPCDPKLLHLTQSCGNDLLLRQDYTIINPGEGNLDPISCTPDASTCIGSCTITCTYENTISEKITVDLKDAQLPIAGNTQLVPNEVNLGHPRPVNLPNAERVNNYLSWYFSGITGQASESKDSVNKTINYSGPLKKLLPETVQRYKRRIPYGGTEIDVGFHNEVVACTDNAGHVVPCVSKAGTELPQDNVYRRGDIMRAIPLEDDKSTWFAPCIVLNPLNGTLLGDVSFSCALSHWRGTMEGKLFDYLPFKTTEDRPGLVVVDAALTANVTAKEAGIPPEQFIQPTISLNTFNPNPTVNPIPSPNPVAYNSDTLFFAHMAEVADLSRVLIGIYRYKTTSVIGEPEKEAFEYGPYITKRCEQTGYSNPGDDLYGELTSPNFQAQMPDGSLVPNPPVIAGNFKSTDSFTCSFTVDTSPGTCYDRCVNPPQPTPDPLATTPVPTKAPGDPTKCFNDCVPKNQTCIKTSVSAPASVYTYTPRADALYDRILWGRYSIYNRIMPDEFIPNAKKGEHFLDDPAVTNAHYTITGDAGPEILAGGPNGSRPGQDAEIYFPHLGAIKSYFLDDMQTALRPLGFAENPPLPTPIPGPIVVGNCPMGTGPCDVYSLLPFFGFNIQAATNASMICQQESGSNPSALNFACTYSNDGINNDAVINPGEPLICIDLNDNLQNSCQLPYYDGASLDYSVGLFQINMVAHCSGAFSSFSFDPPMCNIANQTTLNTCVENYSGTKLDGTPNLNGIINNIQKAVQLSNNGTNWNKDWKNSALKCGIQ